MPLIESSGRSGLSNLSRSKVNIAKGTAQPNFMNQGRGSVKKDTNQQTITLMPSASNIILTSDSRQKGGDDDAADTSAQRMNVGKNNASTLDYEEKRSSQKSLKDVEARRSAVRSNKSRDRTKGS